MDNGVHGDPKRQAVESLRGYAYQLYVSAIKWMARAADGSLYMEVAEDYATLAAG